MVFLTTTRKLLFKVMDGIWTLSMFNNGIKMKFELVNYS